MPKRIISKAALVCLVLLFWRCDDTRVFDAYKSTSDRWHKDSTVQFSFEAPDTLSTYNLFINLRNNHKYPYSNLYLITTLTYPHGKVVKDTLEYKMAAPDGKLLGSGSSDLKENKLWYKGHDNEFSFEESGTYNLDIQHAMRANGSVNGDEYLEGVTDVGFRIEQKQ